MISAAWMLAAIELNGALISRGAQVQFSEHDCRVEATAITKALSAEHATRFRQGPIWSIPAEHCSFDASEGLLKIRLPQSALASRTLTLGESSSLHSVAMLHHALPENRQTEFLAQPPARTIPSAAIDLFAGSDLLGVGSIFAYGPWSLTALEQRTKSFTNQRLSSEYFFANGAQMRAGDFRTDYGVEQRFGEFRGLYATNRAAPLRGEGKAEATLAIPSPSRVQFFDRNGVAVFSSEILHPGNYVIQGYGASTVPGFLEARLVDINGVAQIVALPWSADRRLLSEHQMEWEVFAGQPRGLSASLQGAPLISARLRWGAHQLHTLGLHAERNESRHRESVELNSRAIPNILATIGIGQSCIGQNCDPHWLSEMRITLGKKLSAAVSLSDSRTIAPELLSQRAAQLTLSGALTPTLTGGLHITANAVGSEKTHTAQAITAQLRISAHASLQLQARHQLLSQDRGWSGIIGFSYVFARQHASLSSAITLHPRGDAQRRGPDLRISGSMNTPGLYGPQLNTAQTVGSQERTDMFARYASPYGDGSIRADSLSQRLAWSGSTRLWLSSEAILFAPIGEENLVIQQIGQPAIRIQHGGRDRQISDSVGRAVFRKAPPWTDSVYSIDPKTLPFGATLAAHRVTIPLASNRVYLVDYRALWSRAQHWRIANAGALNLSNTIHARDRHGRTVFITPDGYADIQSSDALPLMIISAYDRLLCTLSRTPAAHESEALLSCTEQRNL